MTLPAPTEASLDRIRAAVDAGRDPLVVFDLDGTLYDDTHRTQRTSDPSVDAMSSGQVRRRLAGAPDLARGIRAVSDLSTLLTSTS